MPEISAQPQCTDLEILGDSILEADEVFGISLSTSDPDVFLAPSTANITIINDDGKWQATVLFTQQLLL